MSTAMILRDNSTYSFTKENTEDFLPLQNIANRNISELMDEYGKNLLVYPHAFCDCKDKIDQKPIFNLQSHWEGTQCTKIHLETGNVIGFISVGEQSVSIHSRFAQNENEDFFLHYMLQKVLNINIVNLLHETSTEHVFDFLAYFFPKFLSEALIQGLYKEYKRVDYNDANVRGTININRQISKNLPFNGRIAYQTREFSYDNHVTELIRHTIEYINTTKFGKHLLEGSAETRSNVAQIISATPNYKRQEREKIIKSNLKTINHPYFTNYIALQKLCLRILRHEKLKYGQKNRKVQGILFDISYVWEEYLATLLVKQGFKHPNNRAKKGCIYLAIPKKLPRYPDFFKEKDATVIDAKYKSVAEQRDDIHQIITYMYGLKAQRGIFIYPTDNSSSVNKTYYLKGYGEGKAELQTYFVQVPQHVHNFNEFIDRMIVSENAMITHVNKHQ